MFFETRIAKTEFFGRAFGRVVSGRVAGRVVQGASRAILTRVCGRVEIGVVLMGSSSEKNVG